MKKMLLAGLIFALTVLSQGLVAQDFSDLPDRVDFYDQVYQLDNLTERLVDYRGRYKGPGDRDLKGLKNVKMALKGVLYWGGGKNYGRDNRNPLQDSTLENLCNEGFETAIYLYHTNFKSAQKRTRCRSEVAGANELHYHYKEWTTQQRDIMEMLHDNIMSGSGPVYIHCWNGLHASNGVAAMALQQFCDYSPEEAYDLWLENAGKSGRRGYRRVKRMVTGFKPYSDLKLPKRIQDMICL